MLVLSRKRDESIMIGDEIKVTVVEVRGDKITIGIDAPKEVSVWRQEIYDSIKREQSVGTVAPNVPPQGGGPAPVSV